MCFSANASFALSALLVPAGAYCLKSAIRKNKALLGLAIIPFIFGIQQICEGFVWQALDQNNVNLARDRAYFFLFFALAFWPFWIPFCAFLTEHRIRRKWLLAFFSVLGFVAGLMLYLPLVVNPEFLTVTIRNHYIFYDIAESSVFLVVPIIWWQVLYIVIVGMPLLIAPSKGFVIFGIILLAAAAVSQVWYWYAFTSVWCFFAALLSLYLCYSFWQLPFSVDHQGHDTSDPVTTHALSEEPLVP